MLASELAMAGVKTYVIERLEKPVPHSKALTPHPRTLELLEMRGSLERFVSKGTKIPSGHFSMLDTRLDFSGLDTGCPYTLLLPQAKTEHRLRNMHEAWGRGVSRGRGAGGYAKRSRGANDFQGSGRQCADDHKHVCRWCRWSRKYCPETGSN